MDPAVLIALLSFLTALASIAGGVLNQWLKVQPALEALRRKDGLQEVEIRRLQAHSKECEEDRAKLGTPWPQDPGLLVATMTKLRLAGSACTMRDAIAAIILSTKPAI